jgi:hypothetical protein
MLVAQLEDGLKIFKQTKMITKEEKIQYLKIALNLQGIGVNERAADQIITTYEAILEKEGMFNLKDAVQIESDIILKYEMKTKKVTTTKNKSDE